MSAENYVYLSNSIYPLDLCINLTCDPGQKQTLLIGLNWPFVKCENFCVDTTWPPNLAVFVLLFTLPQPVSCLFIFKIYISKISWN